MKTAISMDVALTIINVLICLIVNLIGFHFWLVSVNDKSLRLPGWKIIFYFVWKRCFGIVGLCITFLPFIIPQFINDLTSVKYNPDDVTWAITTLVSYPIIIGGYYAYFIKIRQKNRRIMGN